MRKVLKLALKKAFTIEETLRITVRTITKAKEDNPNAKIGYVSGKVTADGPECIIDNLARMHKFTEMLIKIHGNFIFSAADIFNDEVYWKMNLPRPIHEKDFYDFWRAVLSSGITDIYMTPGWEKSDGAKDEHETAKQLKINIHYMEGIISRD